MNDPESTPRDPLSDIHESVPKGDPMTPVEEPMDEPMRERVRVVCAWCGKHQSGPREAGVISHGMCEQCYVSWA